MYLQSCSAELFDWQYASFKHQTLNTKANESYFGQMGREIALILFQAGN